MSQTRERSNSTASTASDSSSGSRGGRRRRSGRRGGKSQGAKETEQRADRRPRGGARRGGRSSNKENTVRTYTKEGSEPAHSAERQQEIDQCRHALGNEGFKLFRNGHYVTTYAIQPPKAQMHSVGLDSGTKFAVNIPHDYPQAALKLSSNKSNAQGASDNEQLNCIVRNFNTAARKWVGNHSDSHERMPLLAQINYLAQKMPELAEPGYAKTEALTNAFYAQFCA